MQPSGYRVGALLELAACVQRGQHRGQCRNLGLLVVVNRNPPSVVLDAHSPVCEQGDIDSRAESSHCLVDGVVDDLPHQVVQAARTGRSDVHSGPTSYRLESFEDGDIASVVGRCIWGSHWTPSAFDLLNKQGPSNGPWERDLQPCDYNRFKAKSQAL